MKDEFLMENEFLTDTFSYPIGSLPQHIMGDDLDDNVVGTLCHKKIGNEWSVFYCDISKNPFEFFLWSGKCLSAEGKTISEAEDKMWKLLNN